MFCLVKGSQGFGFAIEERHSSDNGVGIFVRCLTADGAAAEVCLPFVDLDFASAKAFSNELLLSVWNYYQLKNFCFEFCN